MERRYREVVLKRKKRFRQGFMLAILCLLVFGMLSLRPIGVWKELWQIATNCIKPAVFRYEERDKNSGKAPFFVWMTFPKILAYTWQEDVEVLEISDFVKQDTSVLPLQENEKNKQSIQVKVDKTNEISLLQENIYTVNLYKRGQDVVSSSLDIDGLAMANTIMPSYTDMKELIKDYYVVDASTVPDASLLDVNYMNSYDCSIKKDTQGAQILIYHSHSQEGFADSIAGDPNTTIVGAGSRLAELLEQEYGFQVLHHTGIYDVPSRDNAYSNALPDIERVLAENPDIQVVIDLHRDAVKEGTKLVQTIDGKDYARFMFFNGLCRSTKGQITYLNNPYLKENLAFSFQAQTIAESYFPGITRKIYLKAWRYNMHLRPRNMLIELGAQTNTVEEIMNTCDILAFVLNEVLSGQ